MVLEKLRKYARQWPALLSVLLLTAPSAAEDMVPTKSEWFYAVNTGGQPICYLDEMTAAVAQIQVPGASCANQFENWTNAWPNADNANGVYSAHASCLPSGLSGSYGGHYENRNYTWRRYTYSAPCQDIGQNNAGATRQFVYSCPSTHYIVTPPGAPTPVCRRKADQVSPEKQPRCGKETHQGNPINIVLAEKCQREIDYVGAGAFPLSLIRYYAGGTWRHSYGRSITQVPLIATPTYNMSTILASRANGQSIPFSMVQGVLQAPDPDVVERLEIVSSGGQQTGWRFRDADDNVELYDINGKLTSVTTRAGMTQTLAYDGSSRLSTVTDPHGRQLIFGYDGNGRVSTITSPAAGSYQWSYDAQGRLSTVTYPDLTARTYLYNESAYTGGANLPNALTGIVDENNHRFATFSYDAQGRAIQTEHAGGAQRVNIAYNADGTRSVTDALNTTRTFGLTVKNSVAKLAAVSGQPCSSCGLSASYTYFSNGNLQERFDFLGTRYNYSYTSDGRNLETGRWEGQTYLIQRYIGTTWHSTLRVPMQITEGYRHTNFTRDVSGNTLTRTVNDLSPPYPSRTWTYTYNSFGQVLTEDGPRTDVSDVTTYTYYNCSTGYQCGQVQTITNALNHVTTFSTYNAHGQPLTITDPNGVVTTLTYDARQRLTSRSASGETTTLEYWPTGLLKQVTLPDTSFLLYAYDNAHRLTRIDDSEGNHIVYTLDAMGNRTREETFDPSSYLVRLHHRAFNTLNQLWKEIGAANTATVTTTFGYDNNGNQTSANAPLGRNTANLYDELNRLTQITDPANGVTQITYDRFDQPLTVRDPRSKTTTYTYNNFGDLKQTVSPDTGTTINTFDSAGNLATSKDARNKTGTFSYDALNRLTQLTYPDQTLGYSYDTGSNNQGRLMQVTDGSGSTSWTYTTQGRVASRTQVMGSVSKTLGYGYNSAGQLTTLTTPSGQTITYGYSNNRIGSVTVNSTVIASSVLYDPFGPVRQWTWGNSTLAVRTFDEDGNIDQIDSAGLRTYAQDDAFRITGITDAVNSSLSWTLGYDLNDRLTSASKTGQSQSWTYDANGNRLTEGGSSSSTYTISSTSNQLASVSGALSRTYGYDAAGNTTSYGGFTFGYNDAGRLTSVSGSATASYQHNALGQRVKKTVSGVSTYFVYDEAGHLIGEYDGSGALIQETVWLDDIPLATLRPNGGSISIFYIHTDHLNTPRRISRPSDNVILWRWDSDPFGTDVANQDPDGDSNTFVYSLRFPGQYFDAETGLSYNYFRDYDPQIGRYAQSDPVGLYSGPNTYVYVLANPISFIDPTGLTTLEFRVKDGTLLVDPEIPGRSPYEIEATSGKGECENKPKCEKVVNKGPIPRGRYVINSTEIDNPPLWGDLRRNFGTDRSAGGGDWGDWRVRIYPERGTQRYGRTGFYLHGGYFDGSAGCIDIGGGIFGNDKLLKDLLGDPDNRIPLLVR